ncbi:hypothetical protein CYMTET_31104 [Cymbomonas tetramitiformis]|uniref:Uncharacterized protein n=1 Tax=Cymbomonas tetramitiformis TaxID=36881 RepID=A0AAE0FI28_9CHLO|nr:hypothetical protein CYMTET_31104 [Cymbomonas tetramitiformis]
MAKQGTHGSPFGPSVATNLGSQTGPSWTIPVDGVIGPSLPNPEAVCQVTPKASQRPIHSYNPLARGDNELSECSTDSDSDYDEEEERRKARINRGVQQRKYQVEVIHQQETIRKFRQERELKEQMEAEMAALRANIARAEAWERGDDDDELLRQKRAEEAAASLAEALDQESVYGDSTVARIWKEHADLWVKFQDDPPQQITVGVVPWPPDAAQVLAIMAAEEKHLVSAGETADNQRGELSTYAAYKIAFRRASLRWHPDKFEARFGSRLSNECTTSDGLSHRQQVIARVQGVSQAVNDAWDCIQGKVRHI